MWAAISGPFQPALFANQKSTLHFANVISQINRFCAKNMGFFTAYALQLFLATSQRKSYASIEQIHMFRP